MTMVYFFCGIPTFILACFFLQTPSYKRFLQNMQQYTKPSLVTKAVLRKDKYGPIKGITNSEMAQN